MRGADERRGHRGARGGRGRGGRRAVRSPGGRGGGALRCGAWQPRQVRQADRGGAVAEPGGGLELRDRRALVQGRRRAARASGRHRRGAALLLPGGSGPGARPAGGRQGARLLRLPRPAQRRARALQGRHPLPPGGRPRRGARAGRADDLEDRHRQRPLRRREGRRERRPEQARGARAPGRDSLLHGQDREGARAAARHPGAGRGHERPGDGVANGRVREAARPHAGVRHRQADRARGLVRPRGGHRPRRGPGVPGGRAERSTSIRRRRPSCSRASATSAPGRRG